MGHSRPVAGNRVLSWFRLRSSLALRSRDRCAAPLPPCPCTVPAPGRWPAFRVRLWRTEGGPRPAAGG